VSLEGKSTRIIVEAIAKPPEKPESEPEPPRQPVPTAAR
jgi:hypothetical protein